MRFGLTEAQLTEIITILQKYPEVNRGLIFGSRAMGNYDIASDIDLAIKGKDVTFKTEINISGDLEDSELPFLCDVVNYHSIDHPPFKEHIDSEGVIFYRRDWQEMCLGDFCQLLSGKSLPNKNRDTSGKVPVYGSGGVVGYHSNACVNSGGIIVGRKGTVGAVYLSEIPFWPIDTVFYLTNNDAWELRFAYYLLKTLRLHEMNSDSAGPELNRSNAHALKINISGSNHERKNIAKILYDIDALINLNNNTSTILESMADAIFKSWFVDFEPVQAKQLAREAGLPAERAAMAVIAALCSPRELVGNYPMMAEKLSKKLASMNSTDRETLASIALLFPDSFVDSELGKIPHGWRVQSLSSAMNFLNGLALRELLPENETKIVVADDPLINATNTIITPLTETMISHNVMSKNLADLRDTLLPKLINGDIDVSVLLE